MHRNEMKDRIILVTGATGHQGGAAARHLLEDGWEVRALTRDSTKPQAMELARRGADIFIGDMLDRDSLDIAMHGVYGVYVMGTPFEGGPESEEAMDRDVVDAAAAAGVRHLVYSSVRGAGSDSTLPWVLSKTRLEGYIKETGIPYTIWRPSTFMENLYRHTDEILGGRLISNEWPESIHPMIAVDDIGRFVALAFSDPERFDGMTLTIAGDALTYAEMAETLTRVLDIPVAFEHADMEGWTTPPRPTPDEQQVIDVDVDECRRLIPDLLAFEDWVRATRWRTHVGAASR